MKTYSRDDVIYSINVQDLQDVASRVLDRPLTQKEIASVENSVGDYIDWAQAIENAIHQKILIPS